MDFFNDVTRCLERLEPLLVGERKAVAIAAMLNLSVALLESETCAPPPQIVALFHLIDLVVDRLAQVHGAPMRES